MSAFSVFFSHCPSFLSFQRLMQENQGKNNCRTLFGVETIPSDNQIRNVLDAVPERCLESVYESSVRPLIDEGYVKDFRGVHDQPLVALEGTRFFDSEAINCSGCCTSVQRNGTRNRTVNMRQPSGRWDAGHRGWPRRRSTSSVTTCSAIRRSVEVRKCTSSPSTSPASPPAIPRWRSGPANAIPDSISTRPRLAAGTA